MSIRLEFNSDGFKELLCSPEIQSVVEETTNAVQAKATAFANLSSESEGFYARTVLGGTAGRWLGFVGGIDHEALVAQSEYKVLNKAVNDA